MAQLTKKEARQRRHRRIRKRIRGTAARPRLSVYRSDKHVYVQLIDDTTGHTLVSGSTMEREGKSRNLRASVEDAKQMGQVFAQRAKENNVSEAVFDRAGFKYHGKVKAVADAVCEAGIHL